MIRKLFLFLSLILILGRAPSGAAAEEPADPDQQGPGSFIYEQYNQEPWRLPESPSQILWKCAGLLAAGGILVLYLNVRKKSA